MRHTRVGFTASALASTETNDCAVIALAMVSGIGYDKAHALLARMGRRPKRGTKTSMIREALKNLGEVVELPIALFNGTLAYRLSTLPKTGRFFLCAGGHANAFVNGVLYDNLSRPKMRARVSHVYKLTLPEQTATPVAPANDLTQADINAMWERLNRLEARL